MGLIGDAHGYLELRSYKLAHNFVFAFFVVSILVAKVPMYIRLFKDLE